MPSLLRNSIGPKRFVAGDRKYVCFRSVCYSLGSSNWYLSWRSRRGIQRLSSDYDSVRTAACESVPIRKVGWKEPFGYRSICGVVRCMEVLLGQAIFASHVHGDYAGSERGFTKSFHNKTVRAMLWRSVIILEIVVCLQPERICSALSVWWQRGH